MIRTILSLISILLALTSHAQIYLNPGVDTSFTEVKTALRFYNKYISEFKSKKLTDMKNWPTNELELRKIPNQFIYA